VGGSKDDLFFIFKGKKASNQYVYPFMKKLLSHMENIIKTMN